MEQKIKEEQLKMFEELNQTESEETNEEKVSKEDQKYIKRICRNNTITKAEKIQILVDHYRIGEEDVYKLLEEMGITISHSQFAAAKLNVLKPSKRYIISSAQTGSPVNEAFLENIKAYAEHIDAEIGIIATRYRNPTSIWKEEGDVWDVRVEKYLTANRQLLHESVLMLADLKVQATSPNPTNGIELFGDNASCIVGSPRIEMKSVPTLPGNTQKFLYSTGTVTIPNFTDTVAGGKAGAHHSFGFVVVEIDDKNNIAHIRSVSANEDGEFNDLIYRVSDGGVTFEAPEYLVWGDSHFAQKDEKVTNAFRKLCTDLGIRKSVLHDVWDSCSINTHNLKNPIIQHQLMKEGKDDLRKELEQMIKELKWFEKHMEQTLIVSSNHDDMLDRAMSQGDWRDNLRNAEIFVEMLALTLSGKAKDGIIPHTINSEFNKITALGLNDSYEVNGVELALHGHKGPNGAKGNINSFAKLSTKTIIGHSHSPGIRWGCYQVGVSCKLDHEYNKGLSSWAYAGVTLNKYGKRQLIVFNKDTLTYTTLY